MRSGDNVPRPGDEERKPLLAPYQSRSSRRRVNAAKVTDTEQADRHDSVAEPDRQPREAAVQDVKRLYSAQQRKLLWRRHPKKPSDLRYSLDYTSKIYADYGILQHTQRLLVIEVNQYDFERFYLWIHSRVRLGRLQVQYANIVIVVMTSPPVPSSIWSHDGESSYMTNVEIEQMFKEDLYWLTLTSYEQPDLFDLDSCFITIRWRSELCKTLAGNTNLYDKLEKTVTVAARAGRRMQIAGFDAPAAGELYWQWMTRFVEVEKYNKCLDEVLVMHHDPVDGTGVGRSVALGMPGAGWQYGVVIDRKDMATMCAVFEEDEE